EWLCEQPHVILDGSHNEDGLEAFKLNLRRYFPGNKKVAIVGFMADKTIDRPLQEVIQDFDIIFTVTPDSPRALDNQALKHKIETLSNEVGHNLVVHASDTLEDALNQAVSMVDLDGLIDIFRSYDFVGIMRQLILEGRNEAVLLVDNKRINAAVREILLADGEDPERVGLLETPKRVAKMYAERFEGLEKDPRIHTEKFFHENNSELVLVKDIEFDSTCEHHLLPIYG